MEKNSLRDLFKIIVVALACPLLLPVVIEDAEA